MSNLDVCIIWLIRFLNLLPWDGPVKRWIVSLLNRLGSSNPGGPVELLYGCPCSSHTAKLQLKKRLFK